MQIWRCRYTFYANRDSRNNRFFVFELTISIKTEAGSGERAWELFPSAHLTLSRFGHWQQLYLGRGDKEGEHDILLYKKVINIDYYYHHYGHLWWHSIACLPIPEPPLINYESDFASYHFRILQCLVPIYDVKLRPMVARKPAGRHKSIVRTSLHENGLKQAKISDASSCQCSLHLYIKR